MAVIPIEPVWVDSSEELTRLCALWQQQAAIAIDTEFMRTSTYYPNAALFQVGDGKGCYLLDPLAIEDFSAFKELMINPKVTKVFHSCSEDMEVFQTFLQVIPTPLMDTQIAAAMSGLGFSLGYARLVEMLLNVEVPKSETRSDWLMRPLSSSQLQYAALDVAYLLVVYGLLLKRLKEHNRITWAEEDCARIVEQAQRGADPEQLYLKIKSAWKLNRQQLAVLQDLISWREREAQIRNVPRNRLIKERAIWDMARLLPTELRQLHGLEGMTPRIIKMDGEDLLTIIAHSSQRKADDCPPQLPPPLSPTEGDKLKQLRHCVREFAEHIEVAPEILMRKKEFEDLIRCGQQGHYDVNAVLSGWRQQLVGSELKAVLESWS